MTPETFRAGEPPSEATAPALAALWHAGRQDWDRAHAVVQDHEGQAECDWIHAHLHRVEGDQSNAAYWYRRAGKPVSSDPLDVEWATIVVTLLQPGVPGK